MFGHYAEFMAGDGVLKVRENRARRAAQRQGILISKNARRDPRALDYGLWSLDDPQRGIQHINLRLDQIEAYLTTGHLPGPASTG